MTGVIHTLLRCNALKRAGSGYSKYRKTPQFINMLRDPKYWGKKDLEKEMF